VRPNRFAVAANRPISVRPQVLPDGRGLDHGFGGPLSSSAFSCRASAAALFRYLTDCTRQRANATRISTSGIEAPREDQARELSPPSPRPGR
jgi:hypothetical protein